jgi:hypothetical protein
MSASPSLGVSAKFKCKTTRPSTHAADHVAVWITDVDTMQQNRHYFALESTAPDWATWNVRLSDLRRATATRGG